MRAMIADQVLAVDALDRSNGDMPAARADNRWIYSRVGLLVRAEDGDELAARRCDEVAALALRQVCPHQAKFENWLCLLDATEMLLAEVWAQRN